MFTLMDKLGAKAIFLFSFYRLCVVSLIDSACIVYRKVDGHIKDQIIYYKDCNRVVRRCAIKAPFTRYPLFIVNWNFIRNIQVCPLAFEAHAFYNQLTICAFIPHPHEFQNAEGLTRIFLIKFQFKRNEGYIVKCSLERNDNAPLYRNGYSRLFDPWCPIDLSTHNGAESMYQQKTHWLLHENKK